MKVAELLRERPELNQVFKKLKMDCPRCKGSAHETIAQVAQMYGYKPEDLIKLFEEHLKKIR